MSDTSSVCSSHSATSISLSKMECPYCDKELQSRAMFNHIRKLHNDELLKNTNRQWIEDAANGKALRVWWSKKNDFDEDEEIVIYACLGSNKTFMTEAKATDHFKKDKKVLKEHNTQLKQLKKEFETMKKQKTKQSKVNQDPYNLRFTAARDRNDPEMAHALWRGILNNKKTCECAMVLCNRGDYSADKVMYVFNNHRKGFNQISFNDFKGRHENLMVKIETLIEARCLDVKLLHKVYIQTLCFWLQNYQESIMCFREYMRDMQPLFDCPGTERFYNYATEEMEGVDF